LVPVGVVVVEIFVHVLSSVLFSPQAPAA